MAGSFDPPFKEKPYNPDKMRERIRGFLAILAVVLFAVLAGFYFYEAGHASADSWARIGDAMKVMLPAVTSVVGTVLGFYFGSKA
jgi:hypothetical protein